MFAEIIEILKSTPEKIRREVSVFSLAEMKKRPAPNKWSVQEVLAHLEDVEGAGMRDRVQAMIEQDRPRLLAFDQEARVKEMRYDLKDPRRTLEAFARRRQANVRWLRKLRPDQLKRKGDHELVGQISVEDLLHEWAFHDLGHLKQILEIKRYALYPRMGNMKAFYRLS